MAPQKRRSLRTAKVAAPAKRTSSGNLALFDIHYDNRFFIGLLLLTIGSLLLAVNIGAVDPSLLAYWPIVVIVWGLLLIL